MPSRKPIIAVPLGDPAGIGAELVAKLVATPDITQDATIVVVGDPWLWEDGQAIAGIEELIMTLKPGDTAERPVKWPDDFPDEAQRSKTKTVRVTLADAKRKALPELDDAFARELGEFDSVDAL